MKKVALGWLLIFLISCHEIQVTTEIDGADPCTDTYCTLRAAVIKANATPGFNVIKLPAGEYRFGLLGRHEDNALTGDLDITDDVLIEGEDRDTTIISAFEIDRIFDIFTGFAEFQNITIRHGQERVGAGIRISEESDVLLRNLLIEENVPLNEGLGGGIYSRGALVMVDSVIRDNQAEDGGGIYLASGSFTEIGSSLIVENIATFIGGGILVQSEAELSVQFGAIANNFTFRFGGGISNGGILRMDSTKIANNEAEYGAGLNNSGDGDIHLSNVTIVQNEAANSGGGIDSHGKKLLIEKSTITGNTADRAGGILIRGDTDQDVRILESEITFNVANRTAALRSEGSSVRIEKSTISNNLSAFDAAINNSLGAEMLIENSTISNNRGGAFVAGSGMLKLYSSTVAFNITDPGGSALRALPGALLFSVRTIWHNPDSRNCGLFGGSTLISEQFNIDSDGTCALAHATDQAADPLLGPLTDNGGFTFTHALLAASPARDAGESAFSVCPPTDQRGESRPKDGDGDGTAECDVGAIEMKIE